MNDDQVKARAANVLKGLKTQEAMKPPVHIGVGIIMIPTMLCENAKRRDKYIHVATIIEDGQLRHSSTQKATCADCLAILKAMVDAQATAAG